MNKTVFEVIGMGAKKYGGFEKYIVEEARQLKDKGYRLVVIFDQEPLAKGYIADLEELDVAVEILPHSSKLVFARGFRYLLRKYRPEIVHTNFSSNLFLALPLSWLYGVKRRIATEHCLPPKDGFRNRLTTQTIILVADKVLPVSNMSASNMKEAAFFGSNKIETLYLGVPDLQYDRDEVRKDLCIGQDEIALMNIAYHNPVKGVDVLLKALDIVVNKKGARNLILFQIGGGQTGKDTETLHAQAEKLGLEKNIRWLGLRNDVPRLLCGGDIYVQPSRSEGIPLSIMESSIAGLSIIATRVGGNPEAAIEEENAIVVPSEDPESLAEAIYSLYVDKALREKLARAGRTIALEKFSLTNNVTKLIEKYYRV